MVIPFKLVKFTRRFALANLLSSGYHRPNGSGRYRAGFGLSEDNRVRISVPNVFDCVGRSKNQVSFQDHGIADPCNHRDLVWRFESMA